MSATLAPPPAPAMAPPHPAPSSPGPMQAAQPVGPGTPPAPQQNPAWLQWHQQQQAQQAVVAQNAVLQKQFDAACALIKSDGIRGFRLDIEADSTIAADEQAEKQSRTEFLQQFVPLMQQVVPVAQGNPDMAAMVSQIVLFAVRGFRVARPLEEAIEKAFVTLGGMPPPPPKGGAGTQANPQIEQAKIAADVHDTQVTAQTDMADTRAKTQIAEATLAQKEQQANDQLQIERERMAMTQQKDASAMALENERLRSTERVQTARTAATEARGAGDLV